jgi:hypothetical protein
MLLLKANLTIQNRYAAFPNAKRPRLRLCGPRFLNDTLSLGMSSALEEQCPVFRQT